MHRSPGHSGAQKPETFLKIKRFKWGFEKNACLPQTQKGHSQCSVLHWDIFNQLSLEVLLVGNEMKTFHNN
jgi:hypothetical protein